MKISKLKIAWKFMTGGREGVLDYALDVANTFADRLADAKKDDIGKCLATARNVLDTLVSLSWLCPTKWQTAYALTLQAFGDLVAALEDLKVTTDELTELRDAFRVAYAAWRGRPARRNVR